MCPYIYTEYWSLTLTRKQKRFDSFSPGSWEKKYSTLETTNVVNSRRSHTTFVYSQRVCEKLPHATSCVKLLKLQLLYWVTSINFIFTNCSTLQVGIINPSKVASSLSSQDSSWNRFCLYRKLIEFSKYYLQVYLNIGWFYSLVVFLTTEPLVLAGPSLWNSALLIFWGFSWLVGLITDILEG